MMHGHTNIKVFLLYYIILAISLVYCHFIYTQLALFKIFGPNRDKVAGECRKLHNEELNDLYSSLAMVQVIKSRRMRWVGYVAHMGGRRGIYVALVGKPEGRDHLGDQGMGR
jgi:hypothetical protein